MLKNLNPEQKDAVTSSDGRLLVLAGAGTGKTLVLTTRIAYLIKHQDVCPGQILGLTFTNKAAEEMRQRIASMVDREAAQKITLSTFHSFCMRVLREEIHHLGYTKQFTLYTPSDIERLVKDIVRDLLDHEGEVPSLAPTLLAITKARNSGLKPDEIEDTVSGWHDGFLKTLYQRLLDSMRAHNAIDFDQLLYLTVQLFREHPAILDKYQERYRYLLIDEYQDTNPVQYQLASLLSGKYRQLCVVGDDDQSIYGWRGADVKNILHFEEGKTIKLEQNYRSTPNILNAANALISNNSSRHGKSLWSSSDHGSLIRIFHAPGERDEAEAVTYRLRYFKKEKGIPWSRMAILYRSNALSRQIEQALLKASWTDEKNQWHRGIPYEVHGGVEFLERREVKDLFSYLRVIVNPLDQAALLRIINQPRRAIGDKTLSFLTEYNRSEHLSLWSVLQKAVNREIDVSSLSDKALNGIKEFVSLIHQGREKFNHEPLVEAMKWLVDASNYKKAIREDVKSQKMRDFKWENVQELISSIAEYENRSENPTLQDYLLTTPLNENNDRKEKKNSGNKVQLMTFHSAKGLEFPVCFLIGLEDHILPHEKSLKETGIEEERRLFYVAMTRAKKDLVLSMSQKRMRMGKEHPSRPSRFLHELPKELLQIESYDRIKE